MKRYATRIAALAGAVILTYGLAACGPSAPDVVWLDGPPEGPYEDDPWVQALREADLQLAVASLTHDYTTRELENTWEADSIESFAGFAISQAKAERWRTAAGPTPMTVLDVVELDGGQAATVSACLAYYWEISPEQPEVPSEPDSRVVIAELVQSGDGLQRVRSIQPDEGRPECDLSGAARGVFDPLPDPEATFSSSDVKRP